MTIDVHLRRAAGRTLISDEAGRMLWQDYQVTSNDVHHSITLERDRVVTAAREEAVTATAEMFWDFGWEITDTSTLTDYQTQLLGRT